MIQDVPPGRGGSTAGRNGGRFEDVAPVGKWEGMRIELTVWRRGERSSGMGALSQAEYLVGATGLAYRLQALKQDPIS